jgi:predicted porin
VRHYGSLFAETEYSSESHNLNGGVLFSPEKSLSFSLQGSHLKSEASFDPIQMPAVPAEVTNEIAAGDYDYSLVSLSLGAEYKLSPNVSFTADADYYDLTDDEAYVYGVESGSFYVIRSGFRISY